MSRDRLLVMLLGMHAVGGCAREVYPPEVPGLPEPAQAAPSAARAAPEPSPLPSLPPPPRRTVRRGHESLSIPGGDECLEQLASAGIAFEPLGERPGVRTPVAVKGPIGGIRYERGDSSPLVCDCRLVVALGRVAPELSSLGVTRVRYSGAYVYRTQRSGRPSLHAEGLAIDVHELTAAGSRFTVAADYQRGADASCSEPPQATALPLPNRLACELGRTRLFEEILTPDDNRDHRDHLHLAIAPL
jgi:hypothetical protein